ncbi:hypothetical protein LINPERPRIM_LOCUS16896 [Linum perenne]
MGMLSSTVFLIRMPSGVKHWPVCYFLGIPFLSCF